MFRKLASRLFRFRLRTLFILVTLVCCWLGWQSYLVTQRKTLLQEFSSGSRFSFVFADEQAQQQLAVPGVYVEPIARVSQVRRWLGDRAVQRIYFYAYGQGYLESDRNRLQTAFPEADFMEVQPEPCHPGCFPVGTMVDTPRGWRPIETIQVGDLLTAISPDGSASDVAVQSVFVTKNQLWRIETSDGALWTTKVQPLCLTQGAIRAAGELKPDDKILLRRDGHVHAVQVHAIVPTDRFEKVINLVLGNSEVFVANGFLVRSKPPANLADP